MGLQVIGAGSSRHRAGPQASAVRATGPAARPAHSPTHLVETDLNAALPGLLLPGRGDPAYPFISRQRGNGGPGTLHGSVGLDGLPEVRRKRMDRTARDCPGSHALVASLLLSVHQRTDSWTRKLRIAAHPSHRKRAKTRACVTAKGASCCVGANCASGGVLTKSCTTSTKTFR